MNNNVMKLKLKLLDHAFILNRISNLAFQITAGLIKLCHQYQRTNIN